MQADRHADDFAWRSAVILGVMQLAEKKSDEMQVLWKRSTLR